MSSNESNSLEMLKKFDLENINKYPLLAILFNLYLHFQSKLKSKLDNPSIANKLKKLPKPFSSKSFFSEFIRQPERNVP